MAAREGGGDPEMNPTLRTMYQKARDASVPLDTIERAIKRGTGELEGVTYEQVTYEGYAPNGVAVLVEVLTDNRNRTGSEIRSLFTRGGGSLAEPGAVAWQFERKGVILVPELGRRGRRDDGRSRRRPRGHRRRGRHLAGHRGRRPTCLTCGPRWRRRASPSSRPTSRCSRRPPCPSDSAEKAKAVLRLIDALDDHDDVQDVYANFDIPDDVLQAAAS